MHGVVPSCFRNVEGKGIRVKALSISQLRESTNKLLEPPLGDARRNPIRTKPTEFNPLEAGPDISAQLEASSTMGLSYYGSGVLAFALLVVGACRPSSSWFDESPEDEH